MSSDPIEICRWCSKCSQHLGRVTPWLPWTRLQRMEALEITAVGDRAVVEGRNRGTARSTGRNYEHDWVMVFAVRGGKIVRIWHYYDAADVLVAFRGEEAPLGDLL